MAARACLVLLAALLALPTAAAATLVPSAVQPHEAPLAGGARVLGRDVAAPDAPLEAHAVQARVPRLTVAPVAVAAGSSQRVARVDVATDEIRLHEPQTWNARVDAGSDRLVRAHARSQGDALAKRADARLDRLALESPARAPATAAAAPPAKHLLLAPAPPPAPAPSSFALRPSPSPAPSPGASSVATQAALVSPALVAAWRAVVAAAAGLALLLAPILVFLYHRLRGPRALENGKRARLAQLLASPAGLCAKDAARELGVDRKTACYHLDRLVAEGLAAEQRAGRRVRYFAPGVVVPAPQRGALAAAAGSEDVLAAVRGSPGLTMTELARGLGVGRSTVRWHLRRLSEARLVRLARDGRGVRVLPEAFS